MLTQITYLVESGLYSSITNEKRAKKRANINFLTYRIIFFFSPRTMFKIPSSEQFYASCSEYLSNTITSTSGRTSVFDLKWNFFQLACFASRFRQLLANFFARQIRLQIWLHIRRAFGCWERGRGEVRNSSKLGRVCGCKIGTIVRIRVRNNYDYVMYQ